MRKLHLNFSQVNKLLDGNISIYLDLIRGISAILVVMEHLSSRLFVGYGNVDSQSILVKMLYLLNILGGPSVIVFFVLSGLFISRSVLKAFYEETWSWKKYLINRLTRLYVVLLPALLLTFVLDSVAVNYFNYNGNIFDYQNVKEFLGNLFFLQNIYVDSYGSNAPLWSLSFEFWYYMLFPLLLLLFYKQGKVSKLFYLSLIVLIISTIGTKMNSYFFIWLIGTLVLLLPSIKLLQHRIIAIPAIGLLFIAMIVRPLVMTGRLFTDEWTENLLVADIFLGLAFGFLIYILLHNVSERIKKIEHRRLGRISKLLAGFSFSLYLIHYPIINTVYYWGAKNGFSGLEPSLISVVIEILLVFFMCVIAFFFSRITEAKTLSIRNLLDNQTRSKNKTRSQKALSKQRVV
jgi:peptidoglycan/LPS O-acetylase OafA/YrhL